MANTFLIERALVAQGPRSEWVPEVLAMNITAAQTFFNGAVIYQTGGAASEAPNPLTSATTTVLGLALHAAQAVWNPATTAPANQEQPYLVTLFGASQYGTKLEPGDGGMIHYAHATSGQYFELSNNFASASSDIGTSHQLAKDATTGYWVIATSTTTPVFVITALVQKPKMLPGTSPADSQGGAMPAFGDTNVRYLGYFIQTVVQ